MTHALTMINVWTKYDESTLYSNKETDLIITFRNIFLEYCDDHI